MRKTHQPHDSLFKTAFSDPQIASDYIRNFLPTELVKNLDLNQLVLDPSAYISPKLKAYYSDIVYTCPYQQGEIFISLLFEHKVKPPTYPHLQLLRYMLEVWEQQLKAGKLLSPVIPIIVYHGTDAWKMKPFPAYFQAVDAHTEPFIPRFDYLLTDLRHWKDEGLLGLQAGLLRNILLLFKHFGDTAYIRRNLSNIFWQTEHLIRNDQTRNLIQAMLVYIAETTDLQGEEFIILLEEAPDAIKEASMTLYENILEKGIERGMEQGLEQGIEQGLEKATEKYIRNAVAKGLDDQLIAELTGLDTETVTRLIQQWDLRPENS